MWIFEAREIERSRKNTMSRSRMQKRSCGNEIAAAIFRNCWTCQPLTGFVRSDHQYWRRLRWKTRGSGLSHLGRKSRGGQYQAVIAFEAGEQRQLGIRNHQAMFRERMDSVTIDAFTEQRVHSSRSRP